MNKNILNSGLKLELGENKLIYDKSQYSSAIEWQKDFDDGKYAYQNPSNGPAILYGGIRYSEDNNDEPIFVSGSFMADATFINPGLVGDEYIKTVGHYHGDVPGLTIAYPEIYEAITNNIEYMLQSEPDENGFVDVLWVLTTPGDKIMMLPNWGHVSLNVGDSPILEVDVQKRDNPNNSDYSMLKEKVGGPIYRTPNGLVKNPNYKIKSLRIVKPKENPDWGLTKNVPLYTSLTQNPDKFQYLLSPQDFTFNIGDFYEDIEPPFNIPKI